MKPDARARELTDRDRLQLIQAAAKGLLSDGGLMSTGAAAILTGIIKVYAEELK